MIKHLDNRIKKDKTIVGFNKLKKYLFEITSNSFFENKPVDRIKKIFEAYVNNKNITARISKEIETGEYPNSGDDLNISEAQFRKLFYECEAPSVLYIALHSELLARLTIIKSCVEDMLIGCNNDNLEEQLKHYCLPNNISSALIDLKNEKYFYLYPYFWQVFIYLFGGFILKDKQDEEYKQLSSITKIP